METLPSAIFPGTRLNQFTVEKLRSFTGLRYDTASKAVTLIDSNWFTSQRK